MNTDQDINQFSYCTTGDYVLRINRSVNCAYAALASTGASTGLEGYDSVILTSHLALIPVAMNFMTLVMTTKMTCFKAPRAQRKKCELTELGKMLPMLWDFSRIYASGHHFHPYLAFFFEEYRKHLIAQCAVLTYEDTTADGKKVSEIFDDFISTLRTTAAEVKLEKDARDWESKFRKNWLRVKKLEDEMFREYSRVAVVRLDLHHAATYLTPQEVAEHQKKMQQRHAQDSAAYLDGEPLDPLLPISARVPFEVVQQDRKRFFTNRKGKKSLFKHLIGYVWRIEFTPDAGYHMHIALLFNGSLAKKDEWLAQQIGEYWENVITRGAGRFHNCNKAWDKTSPKCGLGEVNHYDLTKRAALLGALSYLCKPRQKVVVLPYSGCNLFGARLLPKHQRHAGGRPRTRSPISGGTHRKGALRR
jgi:hypothetical protein